MADLLFKPGVAHTHEENGKNKGGGGGRDVALLSRLREEVRHFLSFFILALISSPA